MKQGLTMRLLSWVRACMVHPMMYHPAGGSQLSHCQMTPKSTPQGVPPDYHAEADFPPPIRVRKEEIWSLQLWCWPERSHINTSPLRGLIAGVANPPPQALTAQIHPDQRAGVGLREWGDKQKHCICWQNKPLHPFLNREILLSTKMPHWGLSR